MQPPLYEFPLPASPRRWLFYSKWGKIGYSASSTWFPGDVAEKHKEFTKELLTNHRSMFLNKPLRSKRTDVR